MMQNLFKICLISLFSALYYSPAYASLTIKEVAHGIYVHYGLHEDTNVENKGDIANIGFIVGKTCVAVIDTGGSLMVGKALRARIQQTTTVPICYVINTHMHPDHIFGNAAFLDDHPQYIANTRFSEALASHATSYISAFSRLLDEPLNDKILVYPTQTVAETLTLDLGERIIQLKAYPTAHTNNDLSIYDESTDTLWLADLLFVDRIPVLDGNLSGWINVLEILQQQTVKQVIAGHGEIKEADWHLSLKKQLQYLKTIRQEVRAYIQQMRPIESAIEQVGQSEKNHWLLFDNYHKRNVTAAFAELEWEDEEKQ
ncbi:Zn-dependent hydrolase, glyoxylase [Beggiatoa alba B18LD]|uniref:Zn-dependent hydrolase, glyoxylase n=1 Tax=Beggiatoa alba B18LD TaxID=395493 RepID=I3CBS3_9GAMM|nr:quinoprotein relay system zinc metallohydrolase 2 [Beggiatoa alba]EIJ41066.1 Zn-dependent hydrolase, glyoxylase [Beggiatoa alba B18LD]